MIEDNKMRLLEKIENMPKTKSALQTDLKKYYSIELETANPGFMKKLKLFVFNLGLHCVVVYRFGQYSRNIRAKIGPLALPLLVVHCILDYIMRLIHHVDIDDAKIGPGFYISHAGTIYIGPVTIGDNFSVTHNVTIGVGHRFGTEGVPSSIGNNVWIGTGSVISGDISIGNNVTISSGSILSKSLPDGCLAGGNPCRIILREYDNQHLL
jgi:serine O-acetyltransferase